MALINSAFAVSDSLAADPGDRFDLVLTNPPFGKKSSTTIVGEVAPAIHSSRRKW